jgi:hypothetical protein
MAATDKRRTLDADAQRYIFDSDLPQDDGAGTITAPQIDRERLRSRLEAAPRVARSRLTVDLDGDVSDRLGQICIQLRCSKSDFVREAILEALNCLEGGRNSGA